MNSSDLPRIAGVRSSTAWAEKIPTKSHFIYAVGRRSGQQREAGEVARENITWVLRGNPVFPKPPPPA
jgi:hypothetical protein